MLLDELPDSAPGPQARYEAREAISLAFVIALQVLPPRQRAALILRDVLDFRASEAADILATSEQSVESALKRARGTPRAPPAAARPAAAAPALPRRGRTRRSAHPGVRGF
ncbi:MAG: sigma factor-like helix-turn-helix DNA-binding protein [Streptosporangiaceae bacterium]